MDSWISASVLRSAGLYVALLCDVPKIEVNPKQNAPWELQKGIGNTVRLPYPHNRPEGRMVMVDQDGKDIPLDAFVASAMAIRTDASKVRLVARRMEVLERSRQIAPIEEEPSKRFRPSGELGISSQDAFAIIDGNRRIEAGERDNQFFAIANALLGTGRSLNDAVTIIRRIYDEQTDQVGFTWEEALAKVRNVYGQRH